jgi:hypothetical protein
MPITSQRSLYTPISDIGEYIRPGDVKRCFSISRAQTYNILNAGLVRSKLVKFPGNRRGMRLIEVASLREYIQNSAER